MSIYDRIEGSLEALNNDKRPIVLVGNGPSKNKKIWGDTHCVCCSNTSWRGYQGKADYVVIANEHLDYVDRLITDKIKDSRIIDVNEWFIKKRSKKDWTRWILSTRD